MPTSQIVKQSEGVELYNNVEHMLNQWDPTYSQQWGPGPQSVLPNVAARYGVEVPTVKGNPFKAARWWAAWRRFYDMVQAHELFGAAFTPTEQAKWDRANINEMMGDKEIKERIEDGLEVMRAKLHGKAKAFSAANMNPDLLWNLYGDTVPGALTGQKFKYRDWDDEDSDTQVIEKTTVTTPEGTVTETSQKPFRPVEMPPGWSVQIKE